MEIYESVREQLQEDQRQLDEKLKLVKKIKQLPEKALDKAIRYILKKAPKEVKKMEKAARKGR